MDKSIYILRKTEIQSKIDSLNQELKDLQQEYILSNQSFLIGSEVCIFIPADKTKVLNTKEKFEKPKNKRYAYVIGYKITDDKVVPRMKMANEDGSISHIDEYGPFRNEVIELVND